MQQNLNPSGERDLLALPATTRKQIEELILDLDMDARAVIISAVAALHERELGDAPRDVLAELDDLRARIARLEAR